GVETAGGVDLLRVELWPSGGGDPRSGRREALIPLAQEICTRIDAAAKLIIIDPPDDLLDLNL
ncbi:MAG TPA: ribosome maturation factor RimM, partial [Terriglobia bacterium]|nr:ribosome maturation factor RimM [Terriglobia bacterium]